jgi:hypothetical protein
MILDSVSPDVIVAFGNGFISPYHFLLLKHYENLGSWPTVTARSAEYRAWQCKSFRTRIDNRDLLVLGLPHLSRYTIEGRPAVVNWIKERIRQHNGSEP